MASRVAIKLRENEALARLADAMGVKVETLTPARVKPELRFAVQLEAVADLLETQQAMIAKAAPKPRTAKPKPKASNG